MSRISDIIIDIQERLEDQSNEEIAKAVGCPIKWVEDERHFYEMHVVDCFEEAIDHS